MSPGVRSRNWGEPLWRVGIDVPEAPLPPRTEVAVIGAGFTGLVAAIELAGPGVRVDVLEADRVGSGSSARTGGVALEGTAAGELEGLGECLPALGEMVARQGIACDLQLGGCWEVRHQRRSRSGERGWPDEGGSRLVHAHTVPGGTLDPGKLLDGLGRAALRAGAVIHEGARVARVEPGPPLRLEVRGAVLEADRVLLALNAFLPELLPASATPRVRSAIALAIATEPLPPAVRQAVGLGEHPFYTIDLPYLWGRATAEGRLVFGSGIVFDDSLPLEALGLHRPDARAGLERLEGRMRGLHPALARVRVTHRWGGPVAFRDTRAPILCRLDRAGAAGPAAGTTGAMLGTGAYAGHGVALAFRMGRLAAQWLRFGGPLPAWGALESSGDLRAR